MAEAQRQKHRGLDQGTLNDGIHIRRRTILLAWPLSLTCSFISWRGQSSGSYSDNLPQWLAVQWYLAFTLQWVACVKNENWANLLYSHTPLLLFGRKIPKVPSSVIHRKVLPRPLEHAGWNSVHQARHLFFVSLLAILHHAARALCTNIASHSPCSMYQYCITQPVSMY